MFKKFHAGQVVQGRVRTQVSEGFSNGTAHRHVNGTIPSRVALGRGSCSDGTIFHHLGMIGTSSGSAVGKIPVVVLVRPTGALYRLQLESAKNNECGRTLERERCRRRCMESGSPCPCHESRKQGELTLHGVRFSMSTVRCRAE